MQSLHKFRVALQKDREEARRLREEALIVNSRLKKACDELAVECHKTLAYIYKASPPCSLAEEALPQEPLIEEVAIKRFVLADHLVGGQRFTWTLEISLADASRQHTFAVDEEELGDKLEWLLRLERAQQTARLARELGQSDVVIALPFEF